MDKWLEEFEKELDITLLENLIKERGKPTHINLLAECATRKKLEDDAPRLYVPGASYSKSETILYKDSLVTVKDVREGGNPKQGKFQILTLELQDGSTIFMAANISEAESADKREIKDEEVRTKIRNDGKNIRIQIQRKLDANEKFVHFQNSQGDQWILKELMADLIDDEIEKALEIIRSHREGKNIEPITTEAIIKEIWGKENDGSDEYEIHEFTVNARLKEYLDIRWLGAGWITEEVWKRNQERPNLIGPREKNNIKMPEGIPIEDEAKDKEIEIEEEEEDNQVAQVIEDDIETWRIHRNANGTITLRPRHYYGNWMPLSRDLKRVFPPMASGADLVRFSYHFGSEEGDFKAYIDWESGRILGTEEMYDAFYRNGIYPGTKLVISHRNNYTDYDIRTKPTNKIDPVRVKRIFLVLEDGGTRIEYEVSEEPRRFEIDDEVFICGASWEDLPALFAEADRVGKGFFELMWDVCVERWEAGGRNEMVITERELFDEIHYNRRPITSNATIPLELWRRLAFEYQGGGVYKFIPKYGERVISIDPSRPARRVEVIPGSPKIKRTKRAKQPKQGVQPDKAKVEIVNELWEEIQKDPARMAALEEAVRVYKADPEREKVLFLREMSHERIKRLLAKENIDKLTLDEFNKQIWQVGELEFEGHTYRLDTGDAEKLIQKMDLQDLRNYYAEEKLKIVGNQTWGSGSSVLGAMLAKDSGDLEELMKRTLLDLLYEEGTIEGRMEKAIKESNGFGMNVVSGIMMAYYPDDVILYNMKSKEALEIIGIKWPEYRLSRIDYFVNYVKLCTRIKEEFGLRNLVDVDWFIYKLSKLYVEKEREFSNIQFTFSEFSSNLINYPRPEWINDIEDILAFAEHLSFIAEAVNKNDGASVSELDRMLCNSHLNHKFKFVTNSGIFEQLLSNQNSNRRQMRLYIQLAHLIGLVVCSNTDVRRSNFMISDFTGKILENSKNIEEVQSLIIHRLLNFKVWGPFVGRMRSSTYYEALSYRPIITIIKYLQVKGSATSFELGALFGFVPKGILNENDILDYAITQGKEIFYTDVELDQKINFCRKHNWVYPSPEIVARSIDASLDPGFIQEELLRVMKAINILEKHGNSWKLTKNDFPYKNYFNNKPIRLFNFYSEPDTLLILRFIQKLNNKREFINIDELTRHINIIKEKLIINSLLPTDYLLGKTSEFIRVSGAELINNTTELDSDLSFDVSYDVPGNYWKQIIIIDNYLEEFFTIDK